MTSETQQCPFCKEQIHRDAVKCKHCGSELALQINAFRAKGKITFIGWLGIFLGILCLWASWKADNLMFLGAGIFFTMASYLYVRR